MSRGSLTPSRSTSSPAAFSASQNSAHAAPVTTFCTTSSAIAALRSETLTVRGEALAHLGGVEPELARVGVVSTASVSRVVREPSAHRAFSLLGERPPEARIDRRHGRHRVADEIAHVHVDERLLADLYARRHRPVDPFGPQLQL